MRMPRFLLPLPLGLAMLVPALCASALLHPAQALAADRLEVSNATEINAIRSLLHNGNPEIAAKKSYKLLKAGRVDNRERRSLLRVIAVAEEMQAALHEYSDADKAIAAWQNLLEEFVSPDDAAGIRWKISWLYWQKGDDEGASRAIDELLKEHPASKQATKARILLARINIRNNKLHAARKNLMKFMLASDADSDQAKGLAWMAVVDFREHRRDAALDNMLKAINLAPGFVSSDVTLLSTYVQLLYERPDKEAFERQANRFFNLYLDRREANLIRLLDANVLAAQGKKKQAQQAYERLSEIAPETSVGIKAFMRKLMLQNQGVSDADALKPVLAALHKLAVENQISGIEDEAMLDQARLWARLEGQVDDAAEKALDLYTQVTVGTVPAYAAEARTEGYALFVRHLDATLERQAWLESIVLWRRYAQLREPPQALEGAALKAQRHMQLGVAGAMRRLMDFDAAEEILATLYRQTSSSVEGDRIMLERAELWLDRHDPEGYARVMRWLDAHSFTLYRPEMLLIAAGMQLQNGQPSQASQTIRQVAEQDIAPNMRATYWKSRARIAEAQNQWHPAATAWGRQNALLGDALTTGDKLHRADALFMGGEFAEAEAIYGKLPEDAQDKRWQYRMAVCEMRTGQWAQAEQRLKALTDSPDAAEYATRARLLLAELGAVGLMEQY